MGPHVILTTLESATWAAQAPIVKSIDNVKALEIAPEGATRVFRHYYASQNLLNPQAACSALLDALSGYRHPNLYVETFNEIGKGQRSTYLAFLKAAVPILHASGVKVAGPGWSTGDYDQGDWDAFRAAKWCGLDAISLHAYWGNQGFTPWHALRYRTFWRPGDPPIIISECGRDAVEGGGAGWQLSGISKATAVLELAAYAHETGKDHYVLGCTPFTAGPTPDWENYSTDLLTNDLLKQLGGSMPNPTPTPTTTFDVGPGIAAKMKEQSDVATSREVNLRDDLGHDAFREATGKKGRYLYVVSENVTHFVPFED